MDREHQRRLELGTHGGLVFIAQHQHGEPGRAPGLGVEFTPGAVLVKQQLHRASGLRGGLDQKVGFPVNRAKARMLDLEQAVGQLRHRLAVAKIGAQHRDGLRAGQRLVLPEQGFDRRP